jgi:hypothetical protein
MTAAPPDAAATGAVCPRAFASIACRSLALPRASRFVSGDPLLMRHRPLSSKIDELGFRASCIADRHHGIVVDIHRQAAQSALALKHEQTKRDRNRRKRQAGQQDFDANAHGYLFSISWALGCGRKIRSGGYSTSTLIFILG